MQTTTVLYKTAMYNSIQSFKKIPNQLLFRQARFDWKMVTEPKWGHNTSKKKNLRSVVDPDPYPDQDPYVFGPPGSASGSVSHKYGSSSGSFHHQAKIIRKTWTSWLLFDFLTVFHIRIRIRRFLGLPYPLPDPLDRFSDPRIWICTSGSVQNLTGPQHWFSVPLGSTASS